MKPFRSLRCQLRALWAVNLLLAAVLCTAATPAVRSLFLDENNHPTLPVDFSSANWTGSPDALTGLLYGHGTGNLSAATGAQVSALVTGPITPASVTIPPAGALLLGSTGDTGVFNQSDNYRVEIKAGGVNVLEAQGGNAPQPGLHIDQLTLDGCDGFGTIGIAKSAAGVAEINNATPVASGGTLGSLNLGDLTASGYLSSDNGQFSTDGNGNVTANGFNGYVGNLQGYSGNLSVGYADASNQAFHAQTATDLDGNDGVATNNGSLNVSGSFSSDGGAFSSDGSGDANAYSLNVQDINAQAVGVTSLFAYPASFANAGGPQEGSVQAFNDSATNTWGAVITGGGSYHVLGYYDGSQWTVLAK